MRTKQCKAGCAQAYIFKQYFAAVLYRSQIGVVLKIESTAAFQPAPYMAVYAATKAFVLSFYKLGDASIRQTSVFSKTVKPEFVAELTLADEKLEFLGQAYVRF